MASEEFKEVSANRLVSLDVFRGITIAGMVLVNNPGTWSTIYPPLQHAEWHGWTPTDLVFPFFLFIVGVAVPLAFARRVEAGGSKKDLYLKIIRRSIIIFALGLFLSGFPHFDLANLRIPGVLQRIAVCYLIVAFIYLKTDWRKQLMIAIGLLLTYWVLMKLIPVPGFGAGDLGKEGNLAAFIDRTIFGLNHIWKQAKVYDPEGILSTMPAIVTTISGVLTGTWIRSERSQLEKVGGIFFVGSICVAIGWSWQFFFPINKSLWTSSYVMFTAGLALQFLAFCYWLIDIKGYKRWTKPFVIFGVNALALFVGSGLLARIFSLIPTTRVATLQHTLNETLINTGLFPNLKPMSMTGNLQTWLFEHLFLSWTTPINASLAYAVSYIFFWLFLMWLLYRKKIYIKV
jgi:predicted acyltransferase